MRGDTLLRSCLFLLSTPPREECADVPEAETDGGRGGSGREGGREGVAPIEGTEGTGTKIGREWLGTGGGGGR